MSVGRGVAAELTVVPVQVERSAAEAVATVLEAVCASAMLL